MHRSTTAVPGGPHTHRPQPGALGALVGGTLLLAVSACDAAGEAAATGERPGPDEYVRFEPGTFRMGSPRNEEGRFDDEDEHNVTLTRAFVIQRTEVTQSQWRAVMGTSPSLFVGCDDCPVERVSWVDAREYCNRLSALEQREPCYQDGVLKSLSCGGYRLPTEAEWEYAARAGETASRHGPLEAVSWTAVNSSGFTHPVGQLAPNARGLYDMLGNVWEWCEDSYDSTLTDATDPLVQNDSRFRIARGASWFSGPQSARFASRTGSGPDSTVDNLGFRPVRTEP